MQSEQRKRGTPRVQEGKVIRFKLRESLTRYGSAAVKRVRWNRTTNAYVEYGPEFDVYDFTGWEMTLGSDPVYGYARYWRDREKFEVFDLGCNV